MRKLPTLKGITHCFYSVTENVKAYPSRPPYIFVTGSDSSPVLEQLRQIIAICRQHHIQLHLVIYPYHAHLLEIFRMTGFWPQFERWKQAVVTVLEQDGAAHGSAPFLLWDFGNYTELNNETVPAPGDTRQVMRWYWEAGHFKKDLGDRVLARIFAATGSDAELPPAFGVRLTTANLPAHLTQQQQAQLHYRTTHPADVAAIAKLVQATRRALSGKR